MISDNSDVPVDLKRVVPYQPEIITPSRFRRTGRCAWGRNDMDKHPIPDNLTNVVAVAAGEWCSMALVLGAPPAASATVGLNFPIRLIAAQFTAKVTPIGRYQMVSLG